MPIHSIINSLSFIRSSHKMETDCDCTIVRWVCPCCDKKAGVPDDHFHCRNHAACPTSTEIDRLPLLRSRLGTFTCKNPQCYLNKVQVDAMEKYIKGLEEEAELYHTMSLISQPSSSPEHTPAEFNAAMESDSALDGSGITVIDGGPSAVWNQEAGTENTATTKGKEADTNNNFDSPGRTLGSMTTLPTTAAAVRAVEVKKTVGGPPQTLGGFSQGTGGGEDPRAQAAEAAQVCTYPNSSR